MRRIITYRTASGGVVRRTLLLSGQDIQALNAMCRRNEGFGEQIIPSKPGACASSFLHSYSSRARATVVEDQGCTGRQAGTGTWPLGPSLCPNPVCCCLWLQVAAVSNSTILTLPRCNFYAHLLSPGVPCCARIPAPELHCASQARKPALRAKCLLVHSGRQLMIHQTCRAGCQQTRQQHYHRQQQQRSGLCAARQQLQQRSPTYTTAGTEQPR